MADPKPEILRNLPDISPLLEKHEKIDNLFRRLQDEEREVSGIQASVLEFRQKMKSLREYLSDIQNADPHDEEKVKKLDADIAELSKNCDSILATLNLIAQSAGDERVAGKVKSKPRSPKSERVDDDDWEERSSSLRKTTDRRERKKKSRPPIDTTALADQLRSSTPVRTTRKTEVEKIETPVEGRTLYLPPKKDEVDWVKVKFVREEQPEGKLRHWVVIFQDSGKEVNLSPKIFHLQLPEGVQLRSSFSEDQKPKESPPQRRLREVSDRTLAPKREIQKDYSLPLEGEMWNVTLPVKNPEEPGMTQRVLVRVGKKESLLETGADGTRVRKDAIALHLSDGSKKRIPFDEWSTLQKEKSEEIFSEKRKAIETPTSYEGYLGTPVADQIYLYTRKNDKNEVDLSSQYIKIFAPAQTGVIGYRYLNGIHRARAAALSKELWNTAFTEGNLVLSSEDEIEKSSDIRTTPKPVSKNMTQEEQEQLSQEEIDAFAERISSRDSSVDNQDQEQEEQPETIPDETSIGQNRTIEPVPLVTLPVRRVTATPSPVPAQALSASTRQPTGVNQPPQPEVPSTPQQSQTEAHQRVPEEQQPAEITPPEHTETETHTPEAGMEYIFEFLGKEKLADLLQRFALAAFEQFNNTEALMQTVENEMKFLFATLDQQQKDAFEPKLREYHFSSFDAFDTHWQKEGWKILRNIIDRMVAQDLQGFIESDTELHKLMSEQDSPAGAKKAPDTHGGHGAHDSHDTHGSHAAPAQQPETKEGWIARAWNRTKAGILTGAATSGIIATLNTCANTSISARATAGTVGIFATIGQRIFDRSQYEKKLQARDALRADVSARIKVKFLEKQKNIGGERMLSVLDAVLHKGVNVGSESAVHQASLDTDIKHKQDEVLRLLTSASGQGITAEQKAHYLAEAKEIEERLTELRLDRALFIHDQNNPATAYTQTVRDVTNTSSFFSMAWQRATRDVSGDNHGMFGSKADFWKGTVAAALVNGAVGFTLASFLPRTGILDIQSDMARAGTRFGIIGGIKGTQAAVLERGKFEAAQRKLLKEARILLEHGEIEKAQRLIVDAQKITTWGDRALAGVKTGLIAGTVGAGVGAGVDALRNTFFPQDFDSDKNTKVQQYQDVPGPQEKDFPAKPDRGGIKIAPESLRPDSIANDLKNRTFAVSKGDGLLTSANHFQEHPTVGPRLLESLKQNHQDWLNSATTKAKAMGLSGERLNDFVDKSVLHRWRVEEVERFGVRIPKEGGGWIYTKTLQPGAQIELVFNSDGPHLQVPEKFVTEHAPRVLGATQDTSPKYTLESREVEIPGDTDPDQLQKVNQFIIGREDGADQVAIARDVTLGKNGMATVTQLDGTVDKVNLNKSGFDSVVQPKERTIYPSLPLESRASSTNFGGNANSPAYIESLKERALKFRADSVQTDAVPARADQALSEGYQKQQAFAQIADTDISPARRQALLRSFLVDAQKPVKSGNLTFASTATGNPFVELNGQRVLVTRDNIDEVGRLTDLSKDPISVAKNGDEIRRGFAELRNPKLSEEVVEPVTPNPDTGKILVPVPDDVQDWLGLVTNRDPNIPANIRAEALRLQNDWVRAYNAADRVDQAKAIDALEELKDQAEAANPGS